MTNRSRPEAPPDSPIRHVARLSLAERDSRWARVRAAMAARDLDGLVVFGTDALWGMAMANFRYLTHIGAAHGNCVCVFPAAGDPVVYHALPHINYPFSFHSVAQDWVRDIRPFTGHAAVAAGIRELGLQGSRLGVIGLSTSLGSTVPHDFVTGLAAAVPGAHLLEQRDLLEPLRLVKTAEEIAMLRGAGRLARLGLLRMIEMAGPGVPECSISAAMACEQVAGGADPQGFCLLTSGPVEGDPRVWHLLHGVEQQTRRPLSAGDLIVCEFHTSFGGYLAATEFSLHLGKPPKELERLHAVAMETFHTYREVMHPGLTLREAWEAIRRPSAAAGLGYLELGFHGHGLTSPEQTLSMVHMVTGAPPGTEKAEQVVLQENMVFGMNIDLFDPEWKPNVGVQFGDTVLITPGGCEFLVGIPTDVFAKA